MRGSLWLSVSVGTLVSAGTAHAQAAAPAGSGGSIAIAPDEVKEIVVTAERRATNLQRTPVAATVLTGEDMAKRGITSVDDLQFAAPSLVVNNDGQGNQFNIRGIGKGEGTSAIGVGVITYRDGIATFPGYFQDEPYYDIASVEVLRGPQGTFAGGNATGGAVFINETNPSFDRVKGYAQAQYGNYNDVRTQGAINVPLSNTLAVRLAGNFERRDTFFDVTGPYTGNPGNLRSYSGRISVLWQPDTHWRVMIKGDYNNIDLGGYPASFATATTDPLIVQQNAYLSGWDKFGRIDANISYTTDGGVVFRSITGFQKGTTREDIDSDGSYDPTNAATLAATSQTFTDNGVERVWSQELNIVSPDKGPFTWLLGGYYQDDLITFPVGDGFVQRSAITASLDGTTPKTALAAFGQVGYKLTDALQVTLGARWSRLTSRKTLDYHIPALGLFDAPQADFTASDKATGKLAINYQLDPGNFLYAFIATGTKGGGVNDLNFSGQPTRFFNPESVTDYELGWKSTMMAGHLRTQLGGYFSRYKNFQVTVVDPTFPTFATIVNVPQPTNLYGVEASAQASFGHFGFDLGASVSHSELGRFYAIDSRLPFAGTCNSSTGPATATGCIDLTGRSAVYAPDFTLNVGMQYTIPLAHDVTLTPRVDYSHVSSVFATVFENEALGDHLPAREIVNAQLTLATGPWAIAAYGTNLINQHVVVGISGNRRMAAPPLQYGLRVSRDF